MRVCHDIIIIDSLGNGSTPLGGSYGAIYIATAVSDVVCTMLAGLLANLPLAQASGMGLNVFFVYAVCIINTLI